MKKAFFSITLLTALLVSRSMADLPLKEWKSNSSNPLVFYITGDGGFNKFSNELCTAISSSGFNVTALNAKSYFWDKQTPEKTTAEISAYLAKQLAGKANRQFVFAGYSFGADVMPFIVNRLPDSLKANLKSVVLLSPSTSTDFEIHWSDMLGMGSKRDKDVVAEINRMGTMRTVLLFGDDEDEFPLEKIKLVNHVSKNLPGGHHFEGNTSELARTMTSYFH